MLPAVGQAAEARALADETLAAARATGNPLWIAYALAGYGRAFADSDPARALDAYREGLDYCRQQRIMQFESVIAREAAGLEALHGQLEHCLTMFDSTIDSFHQADDVGNVAATVADLATFFDRYEQPEVAATLYGSTTGYTSIVMVANLPATINNCAACSASRGSRSVLLGRGDGTRPSRPVRTRPDPAHPPPTRRPTLITAGWPAQVTERRREQDSRVSVV